MGWVAAINWCQCQYVSVYSMRALARGDPKHYILMFALVMTCIKGVQLSDYGGQSQGWACSSMNTDPQLLQGIFVVMSPILQKLRSPVARPSVAWLSAQGFLAWFPGIYLYIWCCFRNCVSIQHLL